MRNLFESIAVGIVLLLSILIVVLIVQYNMIEEDNIDDVSADLVVVKDTAIKDNAKNNYLDKLEGYTDVEIKVDPTKEDKTNRIEVQAESTDNTIGEAVEDHYIQNLENYEADANDDLQKVEDNISAEPATPKEEIEDEIGTAIDEALKDIE